MDDAPDGGGGVVDVPGVPEDPGGPGGTDVPDGGADPEGGETDVDVDVGVDGGTVDVVVVGSDGCGGVDDDWCQSREWLSYPVGVYDVPDGSSDVVDVPVCPVCLKILEVRVVLMYLMVGPIRKTARRMFILGWFLN